MSGQHLSTEQISLWLAGERGAEQHRHLMQCAECAGELAKIQATLACFRNSARDWSAQQDRFEHARFEHARFEHARFEQNRFDSHRDWQRKKAASAGLPVRWALAAAALIVLVLAAIPLYRNSQARELARTQARDRANTANVDAMLLMQVDAGISRAVPETMEPLVQLVSWGPRPADGRIKGKTE